MNRRHPTSALRATALLVLLVVTPACASMQQRVTESENRANTLEAQVADLQATQADIISRLNALRAELEAALDPIRAQQAGGGADLRALQSEVAALQEQVAELTAALAAAQAATPTTDPGLDAGATPMPPAGGVTGATPTAVDEEDALFSGAYADYTAGRYVLAISGFEEFLVRYPAAPRAPDALYWIGESLAAQERHGDARGRFLELARSYPGSLKVPDAKLRAALEAVELGQMSEAIEELRQLIAAHARTDAALIGCMQLDRLGEPLPAGCQLP